ncbi:unnamed protein product [Rotaria socialis]|uniref:Uncharacterized protein n=1 Tax=Rotaria socialis TaxID=392032 RepID=A0A820F8D3_9BILA|nr:unnamed protein product [Rotaria socialis]
MCRATSSEEVFDYVSMNNFDNPQVLQNETITSSSLPNDNLKAKNYMHITIPTLAAGMIGASVGILLGCLVMKCKIQ